MSAEVDESMSRSNPAPRVRSLTASQDLYERHVSVGIHVVLPQPGMSREPTGRPIDRS